MYLVHHHNNVYPCVKSDIMNNHDELYDTVILKINYNPKMLDVPFSSVPRAINPNRFQIINVNLLWKPLIKTRHRIVS